MSDDPDRWVHKTSEWEAVLPSGEVLEMQEFLDRLKEDLKEMEHEKAEHERLLAFPYVFAWKNNAHRERLYGRRCRVYLRNERNVLGIAFEDGYQMIVCGNPIRKADTDLGRKIAELGKALRVERFEAAMEYLNEENESNDPAGGSNDADSVRRIE